MKPQPHDMIGLRRGKLTIVAHSPRTEQDGKNSPAKYIAKCDCGDFVIRTKPLKWHAIQAPDACPKCLSDEMKKHAVPLPESTVCESRQAFTSVYKAIGAARWMVHHRPIQTLYWYECPVCHKFHLTKNNLGPEHLAAERKTNGN